MAISKHDNNVRIICNNPGLLGLDNIVFKAMEVELYSNRLISAVDLLMIDDNKRYYIVEYKCNSSLHHKAYGQLFKQSLWFVNNLGFVPVGIYACNDPTTRLFHYEVVDIGGLIK